MGEKWYELTEEHLSDPIKHELGNKLEQTVGCIKKKTDLDLFMLKTKYTALFEISKKEISPNLKHRVHNPQTKEIEGYFLNKKLAEIYNHQIYEGKAKITDLR